MYKIYRYFFIEMSTTYNSTILEIFRENITSKFVIPITLPWDIFLVHCHIIVVAREAVCIVEHAPSYKTTRYNWHSIYISFRLTTTCWVSFSSILQLLIISAFYIPNLKKKKNNYHIYGNINNYMHKIPKPKNQTLRVEIVQGSKQSKTVKW